ncbi:MAG: hypothetical protein SFW09_06070 [Hyphomicrobiaceae bacterium]|nr:hypothetical protein [Hyphomicrobiaceae bacterium]
MDGVRLLADAMAMLKVKAARTGRAEGCTFSALADDVPRVVDGAGVVAAGAEIGDLDARGSVTAGAPEVPTAAS